MHALITYDLVLSDQREQHRTAELARRRAERTAHLDHTDGHPPERWFARLRHALSQPHYSAPLWGRSAGLA